MKEKLIISRCLLGVPCRYDGKSRPLGESELIRLREKYELIDVCPESDGGLPTPRHPSEITSPGRVVNDVGEDVSSFYLAGAKKALSVAIENRCTKALLKSKSPSCGKDRVYDGSFSKRLIPGEGIAALLLRQNGIEIFTEEELNQII